MNDEKNINNREFLEIQPSVYIAQPGINALKIDPDIAVKQRQSEFSWTIDTSDPLLEKMDFLYNLNVPNPDWKIFSLWVDWNIFTFKIWFFNNTNLAYLQFASSLQIKLWNTYSVSYISGTTVRISKVDWTSLSISNPWRTKQFVLSSFNSDSIIKITIDWTDFTLDWATFSWNPNSALLSLQSQLSSWVYYSDVSWWTFIIARQDWNIVNISKTQYDRYTYLVSWYSNFINPTSINVWWSSWTSEIKEYRINVWIDGNNSTYQLSSWLTFSPVSVTISFSNIWALSPSENNDNSNSHWTKALDMIYWLIWAWYTKWTIQSFATSWVDFWGYQFSLRKNDYSQISITQSIDFVKDTTLALHNIANQRFWAIETNNKADITISNYTEITITLSVFSNNFKIPVSFVFKTVIMETISSSGTSSWEYKEDETQSCTAKYGSTTEFISWKIFKTDNNNFWEIVLINRNFFVMKWTVTVSNKINYTLYS